jgi:regulator of protease activity HflC (stomatin/prohibitin superfamily)
MKEDRAPAVYTKYRQEIDTLKDGVIRDIVRDSLARAAASMTVDEVVGEGRAAFEDGASKAIRERLEPEGFTIDNFALINEIRVPASIKQRIDEKIATTQQAIAAENKLRETKAVAQQKIEEARGEAEAVKLKAAGEAEANAIIAHSITPELGRYRLTEQTIEKWDGKLPQVTSDRASPFVSLEQAALPAK